MPLFSIITINYNNAKGLQQTMQTVREQTCKNYEYLIIDGGSTDGSVDAIKENESHINIWLSEKDKGIYNAMNKGIDLATGDYLFFLNSGDVFNQNDVLQQIEATAADLKYDYIIGNVQIGDRVLKAKQELSLFYLIEIGLCHQALMIKREAFSQYGKYDESYKIIADSNHLILCLLKYNCPYKYIDVLMATVEAGGVSQQSVAFNLNERKRFLEDHFPLIAGDYREFVKYKRADYIQRGKNFLKRKFPKN